MLYFVRNGNEVIGPLSRNELQARIDQGLSSPMDPCMVKGTAGWRPVSQFLSGDADDVLTPLYLYISPARLIILSIVSFNLYELYWIYKNWQFIQKRTGMKMMPFWRGWFGIFHCHSLLRFISDDEAALRRVAPRFNPSLLATGWVLLTILSYFISRLPSTDATILGLLIPSYLFLLPVQNYINEVEFERNKSQEYHPWSAGHIVCIVVGSLLWLSTLFLFSI